MVKIESVIVQSLVNHLIDDKRLKQFNLLFCYVIEISFESEITSLRYSIEAIEVCTSVAFISLAVWGNLDKRQLLHCAVCVAASKHAY